MTATHDTTPRDELARLDAEIAEKQAARRALADSIALAEAKFKPGTWVQASGNYYRIKSAFLSHVKEQKNGEWQFAVRYVGDWLDQDGYLPMSIKIEENENALKAIPAPSQYREEK